MSRRSRRPRRASAPASRRMCWSAAPSRPSIQICCSLTSLAAICIAARGSRSGSAGLRGRRRRHRLGRGVPGAGIARACRSGEDAVSTPSSGQWRQHGTAAPMARLGGRHRRTCPRGRRFVGAGCLALSGASGAHAATAAESAALAQAGDFAVRGISTVTGHLKEAQFPFAVALAALAIRNGAGYPPFDPAHESAFDGVPEAVLATTVGYHRFEGAALVSSGLRKGHGNNQGSSRPTGRRRHRHRRRHLARRRQGGQLGRRSPPGAPAFTRSRAFRSIISNTRISGTVDFLASSNKGAAALTYELAETAAREAIDEAGFPTAISADRSSSPRRRSSWIGATTSRSTIRRERIRRSPTPAVGGIAPADAATSSKLRSSARSPTGSPTVSARTACRSRCRPPALPAPPRSSSASRRSGAANATARCRSAPTARRPPKR